MATEPQVTEPGLVDLSVLLAAKAWGVVADERFLNLFAPDRRPALRAARESIAGGSPEGARDGLIRERNHQIRPDLGRAHVTWWARALQDEPLSVRQTVADNLPPELGDALRGELGPSAEGPHEPGSLVPFALDAVMALWAERLVGDVPERPDDPPVIVALTRLDSKALARLVRVVGLAKWVMSDRRPPLNAHDDLSTIARLEDVLGDRDSRAVALATRDVSEADPEVPRSESRLGLLTVARLLRRADPFRARWALQHLPYPTARTLRRLMERQAPRSNKLADGETDYLRAAWLFLVEVKRIELPWTWGGPR